MSYTFSEVIPKIIAELPAAPCQFVLSLGTGSGKYASGISPFVSSYKGYYNVILAIDTNFAEPKNRNAFIATLGLLPGMLAVTKIYFVHEKIPTSYAPKTFTLRLRTILEGKITRVLFGFADHCVPSDDYPLLPLIPVLRRILDQSGTIIVQNEIYFYTRSAPFEHNDSYYQWNPSKINLPSIYAGEGKFLNWGSGIGAYIENEHMQDLCEIPYIMRQLRPEHKVLYLERGNLRPFVIENERNVYYDDSSGYKNRVAASNKFNNNLEKLHAKSVAPAFNPKFDNKEIEMIVWSIMSNRNLINLIRMIRFTGINRKFKNDWTYLHYAVYLGFKKGVEYLVNNGADLNARSDDGKTPLDFTHSSSPSSGIHEIDMKSIREILEKAAAGADAVAAEGSAVGGAGAAAAAGGAGADAVGGAGAAAAGGAGAGGSSSGGSYTKRRRQLKQNKRKTTRRRKLKY